LKMLAPLDLINSVEWKWIEDYSELIDLAQTYRFAFDELLETLVKEKKVYLYDYISLECWKEKGKFGVFHNGHEFYATFECQEYVE